ncbi:MAG: histidine triad nucleotide-binding protein [Rhodospirillales bacterium]|nr:histidine triad nucleotide-binding protein [Rhodospirillales bacterium]
MSTNGLPPYDPQNIFARILRGEIPCERAHETPHTLAFHDINPLAPVHVLVIPKGAYVSSADFGASATPEEITDFWRTVAATAQLLGLEQSGYRILANAGVDAGQEVPHFHMHIFGGRPLGRMVPR